MTISLLALKVQFHYILPLILTFELQIFTFLSILFSTLKYLEVFLLYLKIISYKAKGLSIY
jgi:hypothetical protein